ncbi:MAG: NAD(P)-dependent oxidoreductase [Monoglobales bacterium]
MNILVIGGTGHVGKFLCEILKERGHEVTIATRSGNAPEGMKAVVCDSADVSSLATLKDKGFDTVIEFPGHAKAVYDALSGYVKHIIACGSLWMLGAPKTVPTPAITQSPCPFAGYARRYEEIGQMLADEKCLFTAFMVPNICGPGKIPIDGLGGRDINVHKAHKRGEKVYLPDGPEPLISPCDAYDLAMIFALAAEKPDKSGNEMFNVGPEKAITSTEFIKAYAKIYGSKIPIEYVSWEKYKNEISPSIGHWWHFYAHMCPDNTKAKELLGYIPKYTAEQSMERAVKWMQGEGLI